MASPLMRGSILPVLGGGTMAAVKKYRQDIASGHSAMIFAPVQNLPAGFNGNDPFLLSCSISPVVHFSSANGLAWICTLSILTGCCGLLFLSTGIASITSRVSHPSNTLPKTVFFPSR
jgi:hypothetical protein